jgi:hypothetical protein
MNYGNCYSFVILTDLHVSEILRAVFMKLRIFWSYPLKVNGRFRGACRLSSTLKMEAKCFPNRRLTCNGLHSLIVQRIDFFLYNVEYRP